jgi:hypothetical protein
MGGRGELSKIVHDTRSGVRLTPVVTCSMDYLHDQIVHEYGHQKLTMDIPVATPYGRGETSKMQRGNCIYWENKVTTPSS